MPHQAPLPPHTDCTRPPHRYTVWWFTAVFMALVNAGLEPTKLAFYSAENFS